MASTVNGSHNDDVLQGSSGDDRMFGFAGDDVLRGGSGDDLLSGGSGDDQLFGGSGDDELQGGSGDDQLSGGSGDDKLSAGSGDDLLLGGSGDDSLSGGAGDDALEGGSGDDNLEGGSGDDVLQGGAGDDRLSGGAGDNTFAFSGSFGSDVITDFGPNDTIDLTAFSAITDIDQLTIEEVNGSTIISLPGADGGTIEIEGQTPADVLSKIAVACVMRRTLIRTPTGDVPVETLAIGDLVETIEGTSEKLKWIGRRAYSRAFLGHGEKIAPIVFEPDALGKNQPNRALYVSPEHAMYVDNVLVPARLMVNGSTIRQIRDFDLVEYFHLEFEESQVVLTNGAASESYTDTGNRRMFANYEDYAERYGDNRQETKEADANRRFYLVTSGAALQAIKRRIDPDLASVA